MLIRSLLVFLLVMTVIVGDTYPQMLTKERARAFDTKSTIDTAYQKGKGNSGFVLLHQDISNKMRVIFQLNYLDGTSCREKFLQLGMGGDVDVFSKYLSFHAGFKCLPLSEIAAQWPTESYGVVTASSGNEGHVAMNSCVELGGRVIFSDVHKKMAHKVHTGTFYKKRMYYYNGSWIGGSQYINMKIRFPGRQIMTLRGGYYSNTMILHTSMNNYHVAGYDKGVVIAQDGTVLSRCYINSFSKGGYIGLSLVQLLNVLFTLNGQRSDGVFLSTYFKEIYADVLLANVTIAPVIDNGGKHRHEIVVNIPGSFQARNKGVRVGIRTARNYWGHTHLSVGHTLELGYRPGLKTMGTYMNAGLSFGWVK